MCGMRHEGSCAHAVPHTPEAQAKDHATADGPKLTHGARLRPHLNLGHSCASSSGRYLNFCFTFCCRMALPPLNSPFYSFDFPRLQFEQSVCIFSNTVSPPSLLWGNNCRFKHLHHFRVQITLFSPNGLKIRSPQVSTRNRGVMDVVK